MTAPPAAPIKQTSPAPWPWPLPSYAVTGAPEAEVKALREQFKTLADDEDAKLTDKQIPD